MPARRIRRIPSRQRAQGTYYRSDLSFATSREYLYQCGALLRGPFLRLGNSRLSPVCDRPNCLRFTHAGSKSTSLDSGHEARTTCILIAPLILSSHRAPNFDIESLSPHRSDDRGFFKSPLRQLKLQCFHYLCFYAMPHLGISLAFHLYSVLLMYTCFTSLKHISLHTVNSLHQTRNSGFQFSTPMP
jgi:hypothetical protein